MALKSLRKIDPVFLGFNKPSDYEKPAERCGTAEVLIVDMKMVGQKYCYSELAVLGLNLTEYVSIHFTERNTLL